MITNTVKSVRAQNILKGVNIVLKYNPEEDFEACREQIFSGLANSYKGWEVLSVDFKPVIRTCRATFTAPWENEDYREKMRAVSIKANLEHMELHREIGEKVWGNKRLRYPMTTPENISFCIEGLNRFCKENDLDTSNMAKVAKGKAKYYKGWKCKVL